MRLYLDTNILVFYLYNRDELSTDVKASLFDYSNTLLTSTVCVHELIHLVQIGKVQAMERGRHKSIDPLTVVDAVRDAGLGIEQVSENTFRCLLRSLSTTTTATRPTASS